MGKSGDGKRSWVYRAQRWWLQQGQMAGSKGMESIMEDPLSGHAVQACIIVRNGNDLTR